MVTRYVRTYCRDNVCAVCDIFVDDSIATVGNSIRDNDRRQAMTTKTIDELRTELIDCIDSRRFDAGYPRLLYKDIEWLVDEAIQSKVKALITEAIFIEQEAILDFAERRQANGLLVPIQAGLLPWLKDRIELKENK